MSKQIGWCVRPSLYVPGTAYVIDDTGREIAFCQTVQDAERIVALANASKLAPAGLWRERKVCCEEKI